MWDFIIPRKPLWVIYYWDIVHKHYQTGPYSRRRQRMGRGV